MNSTPDVPGGLGPAHDDDNPDDVAGIQSELTEDNSLGDEEDEAFAKEHERLEREELRARINPAVNDLPPHEELADQLVASVNRAVDAGDPLVDFLRARLDDDERAIAGSGDLGWLTYRRSDGSVAYTIPASLAPDGTWVAVGAVARDFASAVVVSREHERLAEVDAKRRILDWLVDCEDKALDGNWWNLEVGDAFKALAQPYAAHPSFRDEWRMA